MDPRKPGRNSSAVVIPFPDLARRQDRQQIVHLSPEYEGLCLLYSHHALSSDKLYAIRILCWARLADGSDVALVPWLKGIARCCDLDDPDSGRAEGYYHPATDQRFTNIPEHHRRALEAMNAHRSTSSIQEIPDLTGTHAAMLQGNADSFQLEPIVSWRLDDTGEMTAMLADTNTATQWPVLPGDPCLYPADKIHGFRYFFQYHIANQIKNGGEMSTRALSKLLTP